MTYLNASSRIMYEEAQRMGINCSTFDDHETILMQHQGKSWYTRGSRTSLQSSVGKSIADNKALTKKILTHFELPTAAAIQLDKSTNFNELEKLTFPLVMKPLDARHGQGVVVGIQSIEAALLAYEKSGYSKVLFEETLVGVEYRIVCVDYLFVAAAFRKPAHVIGDGTHTIAELIELKNQHPWRGKGHQANLTLIEVDDLVLSYLQEQDFHLSSVPQRGQEVLLRQTANLSTGGEAWDVSDQVCAENRTLFEKIARVCDLNTVGIDIMCQSLTTPITQQSQAGVIEVNASPGLRMHHYPIQGEAKNIAQKIIEMVKAHI